MEGWDRWGHSIYFYRIICWTRLYHWNGTVLDITFQLIKKWHKVLRRQSWKNWHKSDKLSQHLKSLLFTIWLSEYQTKTSCQLWTNSIKRCKSWQHKIWWAKHDQWTGLMQNPSMELGYQNAKLHNHWTYMCVYYLYFVQFTFMFMITICPSHDTKRIYKLVVEKPLKHMLLLMET